MNNKCVVVAELGDEKYSKMHEQSRRVYGTDAVCPTVHTSGGGGQELKIAEVVAGVGEKKSNGGTQFYQQDRVYNGDVALALPEGLSTGSYMCALDEQPIIYDGFNQRVRAEKGTVGALTCKVGGDPKRNGQSVIEPSVIRMTRTDEGKALRKKYESHEISHGFNEYRKPELREDGNSNSLTSVQKDNMVAIPQATKAGVIHLEIGGVADLSYPSSETRRGRVQENGTVAPTLTLHNEGKCRIELADGVDVDNPSEGDVIEIDGKGYVFLSGKWCRVRKLTPKECWRLMAFDDADFQRASAVVSPSQLYKQAGNSIVVEVLRKILRQMIPDREQTKLF